MDRLDDRAIDDALAALNGWERVGDTLERTVRRKGFRDAVALINAIADEANTRNHHPDLCLTDYRMVTIRLTSHDAGGITTRDIGLAGAIDALVDDTPAG